MADLSELETRVAQLERRLRVAVIVPGVLFMALCASEIGLLRAGNIKARSLTLSDGEGELELTPTGIDMANSKMHVVFHVSSNERDSSVDAQLANQAGDPIWDVSCNHSATGMILNMANGKGAFDCWTKDNKEMWQFPVFACFV